MFCLLFIRTWFCYEACMTLDNNACGHSPPPFFCKKLNILCSLNVFCSAGSSVDGDDCDEFVSIHCWMAVKMAAADKRAHSLIQRDWHQNLTFTADVLDGNLNSNSSVTHGWKYINMMSHYVWPIKHRYRPLNNKQAQKCKVHRQKLHRVL